MCIDLPRSVANKYGPVAGALLESIFPRSAVALLWEAQGRSLVDFRPIPKAQKNGRIPTPPQIIQIQSSAPAATILVGFDAFGGQLPSNFMI